MNWKDYEKEILNYFTENYPGFSVRHDQVITGKFSKTERQIDILIEGLIAGFKIVIVIDCKFFSKNIDVKTVDSFASMVEDIEAHQGVLITNKGFSKAAINRAYHGNSKVELDILNFDELKEFQGLAAIPYAENNSVIFSAPFGWIVDVKDKVNSIASLYQRGLTLKDAQKCNEWMYIDFWKLKRSISTIDELINFQNSYMIADNPGIQFKYDTLVSREDSLQTKIRIANVEKQPFLEVTGFLKLEKAIFFCVLFTPRELLKKNLRKLQFILTTAVPIEIVFDNNERIEGALLKIDKVESVEEKANLYTQIGTWFRQMLNYEDAFRYYKKSIETIQNQYKLLKHLISDELEFGNIEEALKYASILFEIEPQNPTVPQDLIRIFSEEDKTEILKDFFLSKVDSHDNDEVKGNLLFHTGLLLSENTDVSLGYFRLAQNHFGKVLPKDHPVFGTLNDHFALLSSKPLL